MLASHNESEIWGEGLFLFLGHYSSNNFSATFGSLMAPGLSLLVFPASASSDYSQPVCSHPGSDLFLYRAQRCFTLKASRFCMYCDSRQAEVCGSVFLSSNNLTLLQLCDCFVLFCFCLEERALFYFPRLHTLICF